jgi:hypothetical protein
MDIAGALLEGVLQQPVDDADNMLIVGIGLTHGAKFEHLLQVADLAALADAGGASTADRTRHGVKLTDIALQIARVCKHAPDRPAQHMLEIGLPGALT